MSATDKAKNKVDKLSGQVREKLGRVTGDEDQEAQGRAEQAKADLKDAGEKIKDAVRD